MSVRAYRDERDWWRIRDLLVDVYQASPPSWTWDVRRWDGWRFHNESPRSDAWLGERVAVAEADDGTLLGVVNPEYGGDPYIAARPGRTDVEIALLGWAEAHLAAPAPGGGARRVGLVVGDDDVTWQSWLAPRGYRRQPDGGWIRAQRLDDRAARPPRRPLPPGYVLRRTEPTDADCERMVALLNAAFGRTMHVATEYRTFMDRSPSFDHALNLVAAAPDGGFAAHAAFSAEPRSGHAILEPVCTHPDHRRLGLAEALILEGLQRVTAMGLRTASVETGDGEGPNALYVRCGFTDGHHAHTWSRDL